MDILSDFTPLLNGGVFLIGLLIGSFLNVVILRYPPRLEHEWRCQCRELLGIENAAEAKPPGLIISRSRCPACKHRIRSWENIPVLSYLFLGGKCSSCKAPISLRYPIVELGTGLIFLFAFLNFGPGDQGLAALLLSAFLIVMTGVDLDHQLLPDTMTMPLMWIGIGLSFWTVFTDLQSSVIGAMAGYLSLWAVYHLFRILTKKEGMGYGDFKLMAALGAWLGWQMLPLIILLSSIVGATVGLILMGTGKLSREKPMPFGPFIAAAGWIALIWGRDIIDYYLYAGSFG